MKEKGKFIFAFIYAVAVVAVPFFSGDDRMPHPDEWVAIAIAILNAALVYLIPVLPSAPWTKTVIGAGLAALQVLSTVILGGVDGNDVLLIAFAVASYLGIHVAPAESPRTGTAVGWGSDSPTSFTAAR